MVFIYFQLPKYSKLSKLDKIYFRDEIITFNAAYEGKIGEIKISFY
jgi:hypothetical protein